LLAGGNDRHWSPTTFLRKTGYAVQSLPFPIVACSPIVRKLERSTASRYDTSLFFANGPSGRGQLIPVLTLKSHSRHGSRLSGHVRSGHSRQFFSAHANHLGAPIT